MLFKMRFMFTYRTVSVLNQTKLNTYVRFSSLYYRKRSASALAYIIETSLDQSSSEKPLRGCVAATAGTADVEEQTFALATSVSSSRQKSLECVHNCDVYFEVPTKSTAKTSFRRELVLISVPSLLLCSTFACTDALKTVVSFAMKHYNYERYPLNASLVVLVIEMVKAVIALGLHLAKGGGKLLTKFDSRILVPCAIYVITNNLFFIALFFVSPAVWMVLIQIRLPLLLLIYRLMFKRTTVPAQWVGAVFSVVFMQVPKQTSYLKVILDGLYELIDCATLAI